MPDNAHDRRKTLDNIAQLREQWARERLRRRHAKQLRDALAQAGRRVPANRSRVEQQRVIEQLQTLRQQIADVAAERDAARREIRDLQTTLAQSTARVAGPLNWPVMAASVLLVLGALASATSFQETHSPWRSLPSPVEAARDAVADKSGARDAGSGKERTAPATKKRRYAGPVTHRQWGPLLATAQAVETGAPVRHDPLVQRQQRDLLALGFDLGQASADGLKGARTSQALEEFRALYVSGAEPERVLDGTGLATLIGVYAQLAQRDAENFGIDRGVLAAIRLASVRTGVEFGYLMELAAAESNFDPVAKAAGSSAAGLFQFTQDTWLDTVRAHGEKYGLTDYASQIEYVVDRAGNRRPMMRDVTVYQQLLELRLNPRVAALMAAESVKDHSNRLASVFERKPARTELYLTHFLGPDAAVFFLQGLDENPGLYAADLFPEAAQYNRSIFHPQTCQPRTLNQVYEVFSRKFDTSRYEAWSLPRSVD